MFPSLVIGNVGRPIKDHPHTLQSYQAAADELVQLWADLIDLLLRPGRSYR